MKRVIFLFGISSLLTACSFIKPVGMFDEPASKPEPRHIENFYALDILKDDLSSEVWFTENVRCIKVVNTADIKFAGTSALHIKWDKQEGGCTWIGMGVGWNGWSGKDLSTILNKAAIQFKVYSPNGKVKSLPLAMSLEDYSGKAAWQGITPQNMNYLPNEEWATVTMPLSAFSWDEFDADASNIKQMIIQFEAAGEVYFDEIEIVPFEGVSQKHYTTVSAFSLPVAVDGVLSESVWKRTALTLSNNSIWLSASDSFLFVAGEINDNTPFQNKYTKDQMWNGDAIEIAFSTNPGANPKRKELLYSDQHIGFALTSKPVIWDVRKNRAIESANIKVNKTTESQITFELKIPLNYFEMGRFIPGIKYNLEVAIDQGDGDKRQSQLRWNSTQAEGFHTSPALWGTLEFENIIE